MCLLEYLSVEVAAGSGDVGLTDRSICWYIYPSE